MTEEGIAVSHYTIVECCAPRNLAVVIRALVKLQRYDATEYHPHLSCWDRGRENWDFAERERSKQTRVVNPVLNSA
jgi:hypothetical protein